MSQATTDFLVTQKPATVGSPVVPMEDIQTRKQELYNALLSSNSGATAPSYAVQGALWEDTTAGLLKRYDGTNWVSVFSPPVLAELTIASGAITPLGAGTIPVDTESDGGSDDLDTITATNIEDGEIVILKAADDARTVVVKDGTGNIACGSDQTLDNTLDRVMLQWDEGNTKWVLLSAQSNGA